MTGVDLKYLDVGDTFETSFLKQSTDENRNLEETLSRSWDVLGNLPKGELTKIKDKNIQLYFKEGSKKV